MDEAENAVKVNTKKARQHYENGQLNENEKREHDRKRNWKEESIVSHIEHIRFLYLFTQYMKNALKW